MNIADRIQYLRKQKGYSQDRQRNLLIRLVYQDRLYQNGKVNKAHPI